MSVVRCPWSVVAHRLLLTLEPSPPTSNGREALRLAPLAYCLLVSSDEGQNRLNYANALVRKHVEVRFNGRIPGGF